MMVSAFQVQMSKTCVYLFFWRERAIICVRCGLHLEITPAYHNSLLTSHNMQYMLNAITYILTTGIMGTVPPKNRVSKVRRCVGLLSVTNGLGWGFGVFMVRSAVYRRNFELLKK
jgi:hypothetical protein